MGQIEQEIDELCSTRVTEKQRQQLKTKYTESIYNAIRNIERTQQIVLSTAKQLQTNLQIQPSVQTESVSSFIFKNSLFNVLNTQIKTYRDALITGVNILDIIREEITKETIIYQIGYLKDGRGVKTAEKQYQYEVQVIHLTHSQMMSMVQNLDYFNLVFNKVSTENEYSNIGFSTKFRTSRSERKKLLSAMEQLVGKDRILSINWIGPNKSAFTGLEFEQVGQSLLTAFGWKQVQKAGLKTKQNFISKITSWLTTGDTAASLKWLNAAKKQEIKSRFFADENIQNNNFVFQQKNLTDLFSLLSSNSILEGLYSYYNQFNNDNMKLQPTQKIKDTDSGDFIGDILKELKNMIITS